MTNIIFLSIIFAVLGVIALVLKAKGNLGEGGSIETDDTEIDLEGYEKKGFIFSSSEFKFFNILQSKAPIDVYVLVKVRVIDIIEVADGTPKKRSKENKVIKKHFDYILCDKKTMKPFVVIELDGSSHKSGDKNDQFKDAICKKVGLKLKRISVKESYGDDEILDLFKR